MQPLTDSYSGFVRTFFERMKSEIGSLFFGVLILHIVSSVASAAMFGGGFGGPTCPPASTATLSIVNNPSLNASGSELIRVATDSRGALYAASVFSGTVKVYDKNGIYVGDIPGFQRPVSVAATSSVLYVGDIATRSVSVVNSSGQIIGALGGGASEFGMPSGIAVDGAGNVLVTDSTADSVKIYGSDGVYRSAFGSTGAGDGQFSFPTGIIYDPTYDEVYVVDHNNARVQVFSPAGVFLRKFSVTGGACTVRLQGIAVSNGKVYISDAFQGTVWVYRRDGTYLNKIGTYGSGAGNLNLPMGLAMADMKLQVANTGNERVEVFDVRDQNALLVSPPALTFYTYYNVNPLPQTVQVSSEVTGAAVSWTASSTAAFVSAGNGTTPSPVLVSIDTAPGGLPLAPGQYTATVNFTSTGNGVAYPLKVTLYILTVPDTPTNLTATKGTQTITLSWNQSATPIVNSVGQFVIKRRLAGSGAYTEIATLSFPNNSPGPAPAPKLSFVDSTVASGAVYDYQVIALNSAGASLPAELLNQAAPVWTVGGTTVTVTPSLASPQPPGTPVSFTAVTVNDPANPATPGLLFQYEFVFTNKNTGVSNIVLHYGDSVGAGVAMGVPVIWTMDGSMPVGTYELTVNVRTSAPGPDKSVTIPYLIGYPALNRCDFNRDGNCDLIWRHSTGVNAVWLMNAAGTAAANVAWLPAVDQSWKFVGTGDFNKDGNVDMLWRNTSGQTAIWFMGGATGTSISNVAWLPAVDPSWSLAATGDFNRDGNMDIIWRNASGQTAVWFMDATGLVVSSVAALPTVDQSWTLAATGDFNKDGNIDLIWRHSTGVNAVWFMGGATGTTISSVAFLPTVDPSWTLGAVGDFDKDGSIDIIWRNTSGQTAVWFMGGPDGTTISRVAFLPAVDTSWSLVGPR